MIWKHVLKLVDKQTIELHSDAEIMALQMQGTKLCLWERHPIAATSKKWCPIYIVGAGHEEDHNWIYVGTVQQGPMVWHVFHGFPQDTEFGKHLKP